MQYSFVYILTNKPNGTLYIGVTSNLQRRIYEHKFKIIKGFTSKYKLSKLVYYEIFEDIEEAINREKYLKGKKREFKIKLIESVNPSWEDLSDKI
ncbi:MAG: GIY-YIG nuclease family protein [Calditrichia bacterium]